MQRLCFDHLLQNPILDGPDVLFLALNLALHGAILFVRLHLVELILVLGNLFLDHLDFAFEIAPLLLVGGEAELALFMRAEGMVQLGLDGLNLGRYFVDLRA